MDFSETPEEKAFRAKVRAFIESEIVPNVPAWLKENRMPREMFESFGRHELLGFRNGPDGMEAIPWLQNIHLYKSLAVANGGVAISAFAHSQLGNQALHFFGNDAQRREFLISGMQGNCIIAFANTEPGAGSDAAAITLAAEENGDNFILNGAKTYITNGENADMIIVTAVTDPSEEKKHARISMFMVDGDSPGLTRKPLEKHGWAPSHLTALNFKDVEIPSDRLLGQRKRGFYQTMQVFNSSRIGLSALALGTSLGAIKAAHAHATRRKAFGKTLMEFDTNRDSMAQHLVTLQAGWLLVQKAAYHMDSGEDASYRASMAKLFTTESGLGITSWASALHGASGVLAHSKAAQYPLDARAALIGEGAPEVQKKIIMGDIDRILEELF